MLPFLLFAEFQDNASPPIILTAKRLDLRFSSFGKASESPRMLVTCRFLGPTAGGSDSVGLWGGAKISLVLTIPQVILRLLDQALHFENQTVFTTRRD